MISNTSRCLSFAVMLALISGACGSCGSDGEGPEPGMGDVPAPLVDIEGRAEDAYDKALADNLAGASSDAAAIASTWQTFRPQAQADGAADAVLAATDETVAALTTAAAGSDPLAAARAANSISGRMADLFGLYHPVVPTPLLSLDYLGREVVLDGKETDFAAASGHVDALAAVWEQARASVVAAGGTSVAADYDQSVASLRADIAAAAGDTLVSDANAGLDLVDAMENLFSSK